MESIQEQPEAVEVRSGSVKVPTECPGQLRVFMNVNREISTSAESMCAGFVRESTILLASRLDRRETYDPNFQSHW